MVQFTTVDQTPESTTGALVTYKVPAEPPPAIQSVVNAASLQPVLSPGASVSILGSHLTGPTLSTTFDDTASYPTSVASTSVTFNGIAAPLLYVSPSQINAIVPFSLAGQTSVQVAVQRFDQVSATVTVPLQDTAPAIFTSTQTGTGQAAILQQRSDGSFTYNSSSNPAQAGAFVEMFATGEGVWTPPPQSDVFIYGEPFNHTARVAYHRRPAGKTPVPGNHRNVRQLEYSPGQRNRAKRACFRTSARGFNHRRQRQLAAGGRYVGAMKDRGGFAPPRPTAAPPSPIQPPHPLPNPPLPRRPNRQRHRNHQIVMLPAPVPHLPSNPQLPPLQHLPQPRHQIQLRHVPHPPVMVFRHPARQHHRPHFAPRPLRHHISTTGIPTPVASTASRFFPANPGFPATSATRLATFKYGVPNSIRSKCRTTNRSGSAPGWSSSPHN